LIKALRQEYLIAGVVLWNLAFVLSETLDGRFGAFRRRSAAAVAAITCSVAAFATGSIAASSAVQKAVLQIPAATPAVVSGAVFATIVLTLLAVASLGTAWKLGP